MFLDDAISQYQQYCEPLGLWNDTKKHMLGYFARYSSRHFDVTQGLTQEMVDHWFTKREKELHTSARARDYTVAGLLDFMRRRKMTDVRTPDIPKYIRTTYIPHGYTKEELSDFFHECDNIKLPVGKKGNKNIMMTIPVFFRFLYSTGIRPYEGRMIKRSNVNLESGVISIETAKGRIQHYVVLHDSMLELMKKYDEAISVLYPDREYFFPGTNSTPYLARHTVQVQYRNIWKKVGHGKSVAYDFRHNYAAVNIDSWEGQDPEAFDKLVYLSKSMGHTKLSSTRYYYHYTDRLATILQEKTEDDLNSMLPEVDYEDFEC